MGKTYSLLYSSEISARRRLEAYCKQKGLFRPADRLRIEVQGMRLEAVCLKRHDLGSMVIDEKTEIGNELRQIEYLKGEISKDGSLPSWEKEVYVDLLVSQARQLKASSAPPPTFDVQAKIDPRYWAAVQGYFEKKGIQGPQSRIESTTSAIESELMSVKNLQDFVWSDVELRQAEKDLIYEGLVRINQVLRSLWPEAERAERWRFVHTGSTAVS